MFNTQTNPGPQEVYVIVVGNPDTTNGYEDQYIKTVASICLDEPTALKIFNSYKRDSTTPLVELHKVKTGKPFYLDDVSAGTPMLSFETQKSEVDNN